VADIPTDSGKTVEAAGRQIALFNAGGKKIEGDDILIEA